MELILQIRNFQKAYGSFVALKQINFTVAKGRIVGLLGKNGAGKTTLIKSILGLIKKYEGEILYKGVPIKTDNPHIMSTIGSLVDTRFYEDLTAYDNLKFLMMSSLTAHNTGYKERIYELLKLVGLENNAKNKVKSFSMGMKQRLALAQALLENAELLILDEPFVGLDPIGIEIVKEKLISSCKKENKSIIFSSHQLQEVAELCDDIIVINEGKLKYSGTYQQLSEETKEYHIQLHAGTDELNETKSEYIITEKDKNSIIIKYNKQNLLNTVLKEIYSKNLMIKDITIQDNALLKLFQE
jgi:ABC-type multidrug transport system ATPase subunit